MTLEDGVFSGGVLTGCDSRDAVSEDLGIFQISVIVLFLYRRKVEKRDRLGLSSLSFRFDARSDLSGMWTL